MADILALVVDDSRMARFVLSKMLKEQSINVDTVESAEEALGYLCNNLPDMIFMDHTMPGMDGFQAIRAIKNDPKTATVPIMMYTSKEGEVYINQARAIGAVDVLPKQLKTIQLVQVLERQQLMPHQINNKSKPSGQPSIPESKKEKAPDIPAAVVTARDVGQDLEQVAKEAERSIENQSFTNEVKQLLDSHREELSEQSNARSQALLESLDHKIDAVSASLTTFIKETKENSGLFHKQSDSTKIFLICVNILILLVLGTQTIQQSYEIEQLKAEKLTLQDAIQVDDAKAESIKSTLESELSTNLYQNQLHLNQWIANLQWALNRNNEFVWDEKPFNEKLTNLLESTAEKLHAAGFKGMISVTSHLGEFCLASSETGSPVMPTKEQTLADCSFNNANEQQAEFLGLEKTIQFENYQAKFEQLYNDDLQLAANSVGFSAPLVKYPEKSPEIIASDWNNIARQNHRIVIELIPYQTEEP